MSKYLKYFIVISIVLLSGFIVSTSKVTKNPNPTVKDLIVEKEKKEIFNLVSYPKEQIEKVTYKLDSLFTRIHKRQDFNGSILIAKNGKLLFSNEYGYANFGKKTKIDQKSVFQLASVSKQFTATAIMILKEKNLLKLEDSVTNYFPKFPYKDVTIKHLLNHTAGLPNYFWVAEHKWNEEKAPTNSEMMELLADTNANRFFKPGRNFDYSNTGYFVLASIIEEITNVSYSEFIAENIFKPLQMNDSFVYSYENDSIKNNQLVGYRPYKGWRHLKINGTVNDAVVGDKNVYATSEDLYKWITGLNSEKLISSESLDQMYSEGETKYGRKIPYGFGFRLNTKDGEKVIYHYGRWNGFSTAVSQFTDSDLLIIALDHSSFRSMTYLNKTAKQIIEDNLDFENSDFTDEQTSFIQNY